MGKFCGKCGTPLRDTAKFCPNCGQRVKAVKEERSLVERVKNNDTEAWEELYKKTYPKAYAVAIQTLKNKEDAMDVLQEAYVSVFKKIDTLKDESKLGAWVNQIVANRCIDYIRKYHNDKSAIPFAEMNPEDSDVEFEDILENDNQEFMPEESVDYNATKKIMQEILDQLSEEQRLCVLMYYYEELSVSEIAEALGCSTGTIKSRLNYARKYIKNEVETLEKKGTKLYSIAPLPFLVWMLRSQENTVQAKAAEREVWQAIQNKVGITKLAKNAKKSVNHVQQSDSQRTRQKISRKSSQRTVKNNRKATTRKISGKAAGEVAKKGTKGVATKIVAGVVAVTLIGTGVGMGYMKQHTKSKSDIKQSMEKNVTEKPENIKKDLGEFTLSDEQIHDIKVAAALFDNCFALYDTESGSREEYSAELDQDNILPDVLKSVASGWVCTDVSIGDDAVDSYQKDDVSSYVPKKFLMTDECQEFLKDTFEYEADDWYEVAEVFTPSGNSYADSFEASFDGFQSITYNVERCEQTEEDEYHFYVKAERKEDSITGYGLMDITAHQNEKSKIGGFVFDKIEFIPNESDAIENDLALIVQNIIREDGKISGLDSQYDPVGVHEVTKFTNDQFIDYANTVIDLSTYIAQDKEEQNTEEGVYDGTSISKKRYIELCKDTLGWKNENLDVSTLLNGENVYFAGRFFATSDAWFIVDNMTVVQSADGSVQINGTVRDCRKESEMYQQYQYDPDLKVLYSFTASGEADTKSELGTVIDTVEVLELVSDTVDSDSAQTDN